MTPRIHHLKPGYCLRFQMEDYFLKSDDKQPAC
jgi:hypothetical protein